MIGRLVLFGATGDLAGRYLLPNLAVLQDRGRLPGGFTVLGAGQQDLGDEGFRRLAAERLQAHGAHVPAEARDTLLGSLRYRPVDVTDARSVAALVGGDDDPLVAYLALPPRLFAPTVRALGGAGLPAGSRIALEKPFGVDLQSAVELNRLLYEVTGVAGEHAVFRVDHFLGHATVQNLLGVHLANRVLEPVWNGTHIDRIDIVWEQTLALEGRASYYDSAGQLRDMVQNHLLQILCLIAMEPPTSLDEKDLRDRKIDVLRSVLPLEPEDVPRCSRRARYTAGRIGDRAIPSYVDEDGVDPSRGAETFAEVELRLGGWRWPGTRFVLRTGKALARDRMEVVVRFRAVPPLPFGEDVPLPPPNELHIGLLEPARLTLSLTGTGGGPSSRLMPLTFEAELPGSSLPEYARVLLDLLGGDSRLSIRGDETEAAWRIVTPVLDAWAADRVPMEEYPAGSDGPPPR